MKIRENTSAYQPDAGEGGATKKNARKSSSLPSASGISSRYSHASTLEIGSPRLKNTAPRGKIYQLINFSDAKGAYKNFAPNVTNLISHLTDFHEIDENTALVAISEAGIKKGDAISEDVVDEIHAKLADSTQRSRLQHMAMHQILPYKLVQMISQKNISLDPEAKIVTHDIFTESEQSQVLCSAVMSADKLCIVTSYGVKPSGREKNTELSPTIAAFLRGFAEKQHDPDFTAVFFYQKSDAIQNYYIGEKRTLVSIKEKDWSKVISMYNHDVRNGRVQGREITDVKADLYFLAGEPKGFAGTHHSKFMVNDNGLCVTLGASLGNNKKANWSDSGCITLSKSLAWSQIEYFIENQSEYATNEGCFAKKENHCTKIQCFGGEVMQLDAGIARIEYMKKMPAIANSVREKMQRDQPEMEEQQQKFFEYKFKEQGFDFEMMSSNAVAWINNPGTNQICSGIKKPIGIAFSEMLSSAQSGDVICLRNGSANKFSPEVCDELASAVTRGATVEILTSLRNEYDQISYLYDQISSRLKFDNSKKQKILSKINIKFFNLEEGIFQQGVERSPADDYVAKGYKDHGKLFGIRKSDGSATVMTGTYNLDAQSVRRSFENMQIIADIDAKFLDAGFSRYYDAGKFAVNLGAQTRDDLAKLVKQLWKKIP